MTDSPTCRPKIVTLGVYGFTEAGFFAALQRGGRGHVLRHPLRGAACAGANTPSSTASACKRSSPNSASAICTVKELAPSRALRQRQYAADKAERHRQAQARRAERAFRLPGIARNACAHSTAGSLSSNWGRSARVVALFCVERAPAACHRSLAGGTAAARPGRRGRSPDTAVTLHRTDSSGRKPMARSSGRAVALHTLRKQV